MSDNYLNEEEENLDINYDSGERIELQSSKESGLQVPNLRFDFVQPQKKQQPFEFPNPTNLLNTDNLKPKTEEYPDFNGWQSVSVSNDLPNFYGEFHPSKMDTVDTTSDPELAQIFSLITDFNPEPTPISLHFKPFIPDLIPSIGAIDAFIKVPRPDDEFEPLGLTVLDEPTIGCSNPQVLKMELRERFGITTNDADGYIGSIENLNENNQKELDSWLESIEEIYRNRPPPTIAYTSAMPDLEQLAQEWPQAFDEVLQSVPLPAADLDLSIEEYAKIICAILDIPIRGNIIESLHVFFSLYSMFEDNQFFKSLPDDQQAPNQ